MKRNVMTGNFVCDGERPTKAWKTSAASEDGLESVLFREAGEKSPPEVDDQRSETDWRVRQSSATARGEGF